MSAESVATTRYARWLHQIERAKRTIPGGVATAMRAAQRPVPLVIERAAGSRMVDIDGNEYVDYVLGFGPMLLGHSPPEVIEAVREQLGRGFTDGAQHRLEAEVAERVVDAVPCAELVCFSTTGSEAVQAALRIARAATGRRKVIRFEGHYHGWLDPMAVSSPGTEPRAGRRRAPAAAGPGDRGPGRRERAGADLPLERPRRARRAVRAPRGRGRRGDHGAGGRQRRPDPHRARATSNAPWS